MMDQSETSVPTPVEPAVAPTGRRRFLWVLPLLGVVALGWTAHSRGVTEPYAILGYDSFMQIYSARIDTSQDFWDTFGEKLAGGMIEADFYRPVQHLLLALDYRVWGLDARGYHLSSLLWLGLAILFLYLFVLRLFGPRAWPAATIAALLFALHPALLNVLPVPSRRSELVCIGLVFATLCTLPVRSERWLWGRALAVGFLAVLAAGSKETGVMVLGLVFLHQLLIPDSPWKRRLTRCVLMPLPAAIGIGLFMWNRTVVLEGLGGYNARVDRMSAWERLTQFGSEALNDIWCPMLALPKTWLPAGTDADDIARTIAAGLLALALVVFFVCVFRRETRDLSTAVAIGLAWMVLPVYALTEMDWYGPWYAAVPLAGICLVVAAVAESALRLVRQRWYVAPLGAVLGLALIPALCLPLQFSPLWTPYDEWSEASKTMNAALADLDRKLEKAQPGTVVKMIPTTIAAKKTPGRPNLNFVATILAKGVECYASLKHPDKHVRTYQPYRGDTNRPKKHEILVRVPVPKNKRR